MKLLPCAKKIAIAQVKKKHANTDMALSLSNGLWDLSEVEIVKDTESNEDPITQAGQGATNAFKSRGCKVH